MKTYKLFTIVIALACATQVFAYDFQVGEIYYRFFGGDSVAITYSSSQNPSSGYKGDYTGSIVIPESVQYQGITYRVTNIGFCAFYNSRNLTNIIIPNTITNIAVRAFYGCTNLTTVTLPNQITKISGETFNGCSSLTEVSIPSSVTSIDVYAFKDCSNLTNITIPSSVTSVGALSFEGCTSLKYNLYDNNKYLGNDENPYHALIENTDTTITSCPIHENTKVIGSLAFKDCAQLATATIPNGVITIGAEAFSGCTSLTDVTIPKSVTTLKLSTFYDCTSLSTITIPNSVTTIDNYVFASCSNLTTLTLGSGVVTIGKNAFLDCSGLNSITCEAVTPPVIEKPAFDGVDKAIPLYVPAESIEAYKAADYWKEFTNIQGIAVDGLDDIISDNSSKITRKVFENGTIYILRNGAKYTIDGRKVE